MRRAKGWTALAGGMAIAGLGAPAGAALAAALGRPEPWQLGFQQAATPVMENITTFHNFLLILITLIAGFVLALLIYVMVRFNAKANPTPSKTTHNTLVEVVWTVVPIVILIIIAIPSFRLLYFQRVIPPADFTLKATGNQWYWSYEYPDLGNVSFSSVLKEQKDLKPGEPWLLAVDKPVVVPVGKTVRLITTAADVIHAWTIPSFGLKIDSIPGRLNEDWFKPTKEGVYYGQCSELCGKDHAYMPIEVRVVPQADFDAWVNTVKKAGVDAANRALFAALEGRASQLAAATPRQ
jgi:cytochrome c oxidase subunit 2